MLLAAGLFGLHRWQLSRIATDLLVYAQASEEESQWHESAEFLSRYLRIKPADAAVHSRLALTYAKGANSLDDKKWAVELCYRALGAGHAADEQKLRSQLADLLISNGRFVEAENEARKILQVDAEQPVAQRLLARALFGQLTTGSLSADRAENAHILATVESACEKNSQDVDLAEMAATLYREHASVVQLELPKLTDAERKSRADSHLDELIRKNPKAAAAYLARYRYRTRNNLADADVDLAQAILLAPKNPDVLLTSAFAALRRGQQLENSGERKVAVEQFLVAKRDFTTLISENKNLASAESHLGLGDACLKSGELDSALKAWRDGLRIFRQSSLQATFHARIADALLEADQGNKAAESLSAIDGILAQAGSTMPQETQAAVLKAQDLRYASLAIKREQFQVAIPLLQRVVSRQSLGKEGSDAEFYAWSQLGRAFANLDDWIEAAVALDHAATARPQATGVRLAAAQAWFNAGRPDMAAERAEMVVDLESSFEAWLLIAAAQFQLQVTQSNAERNWDRIEAAFRALEQAPADVPMTWRDDLLRAEYLAFRGRSEGDVERGRREAKEVLEIAVSKHSTAPEFLVRLSGTLENLGFSSEADHVIERMQAEKMPAADIARAQARLFAERKDYARARTTLEAASTTARLVDQQILRRELLNVANAAGDVPQVERLLAAELQERPADLRLLRERCELALDRKDYKGLAGWQAKLLSVGPTGKLWSQYYEVMQMSLSAENANDKLLTKALTAQEALAAAHPNWPQVFILRGIIEERLENWEGAAAAYESAIQLGVSQTNIFERLIAMLERLNRSAEADKYLSRLESYVPFSQQLTEFASGREFRRDPNRAIEIARAAVSNRPDDPQAKVWLGRLLLVNKQFAESEQAFKQAIEISNDIRAWNGLFSFYLRTGATEKARATLAELASRVKLEPVDRDIVVAQGLELLGDWDQAMLKYQAVANESPKNALIQLRLAGIYLRSDPGQAITCLRKALEWDPQLAPARRMLAAILATRGTDAELHEAEALLNQVARPNIPVAVEDRRLRALLLAQYGNEENTARAIQLLEEIVSRGTGGVPGDHLILAQLYEQQSRKIVSLQDASARLKDARRQLVTLAAREEPHPSHLIALIEFLLRNDQSDEATSWIEKLESLVLASKKPDLALMSRIVELRIKHGSFAQCDKWLQRLHSDSVDQLRPLLLRAKVLVAQEKLDEAAALVEPGVEGLWQGAREEIAKIEIAKAVGEFYSNSSMPVQAEKWFRRLTELDEKQFPLIIVALARQKRAQDAVKLCVEQGKTDRTTRSAVLAATVLTELSPSADVHALAEPLIQAALKDHPEDVALLNRIGTLYVVQGRYEDSVAVFRRIVAAKPRDVQALNNLALMLAESPNQRSEALKYIDQAIGVAGLQPALLDTKGAILVYDGKSEQAVPMLEVAARGTRVDPRHNLHLAAAYNDTAKRDLARDNLKLALDRKLESLILTRTDKDLLVDLRSKLGL